MSQACHLVVWSFFAKFAPHAKATFTIIFQACTGNIYAADFQLAVYWYALYVHD